MEEFNLEFQKKHNVILQTGFQGELQFLRNGKPVTEKERNQLIGKHTVGSGDKGRELTGEAIWGGIKVVDPTSVSNWKDSYETITDPNAAFLDKILAGFSAIPALGKVGKTIRLARGESNALKAMNKIEKVEKVLDKVPTGIKKLDKPVEKFTGKIADKILPKKKYTPESFKGSDTRDIYNLATKPINIINKVGDINEQKDNVENLYSGLELINKSRTVSVAERKKREIQNENLSKLLSSRSKQMKKKKYAFGGNVMNIQSPEEALFQMIQNSQMSGIEAANDPLVMGTKALGGMATQMGMNMATSGINEAGGLTKVLKNVFASGGYTGDDIEVEGDESFETPNGQFGEFKGPSHEQGGIPLGTKQGGIARNGELPEGSFIYPKRFKIKDPKTGKKESMADRASKRNKKEGSLSKMLEGTSDKILKNTLDRTKAKNQREDSFDKMQWHQNEMAKLSKSMGFMPGIEQVQQGAPEKMAKGGVPLVGKEDEYQMLYDDLTGANNPIYNPLYANFEQLINNQISTGKIKDPGINNFPTDPTITPEPSNSKKSIGDLFNSASMPTLGDAMGISGNDFQAYMPLKTTLDQRKGDTKNINPYENYGDEALNTLNKNYEFLDYLKNEQLQEANLNRNATIGRNNSSTRSLNTGRAMNLATDAQYNDVNNKIYQQYFQNQSGVNDKISGVQLDIAGKKAGGEQYRDLSDRQDRDNFYNNLSKSYSNLGEGVSRTGKSINELKTRGTTQELMNQLSNLVSVNAMTGKTTQKEGIEGLANTVSAQVSAYVKSLMTPEAYSKLTAEQIKNIEAQFLPQFAASNK